MTGQNNRSWGTRQPPGYECGLLQWRPHAGGAFNLRCHLSLSHQPVGSASGHQERPDSLPEGGGSTSRCILGRLWPLHPVDSPLPLHLWLGRRPVPPLVSLQEIPPPCWRFFYALWDLTEAKCLFPIPYTNLGSQPGVNSDSSHGQHRKVTSSVDTGHSTELLRQLSNFVPTFTQHPHCTSLASLKSQVFEMQTSHVVQAGVVAPSGLKLWL